MIYCITLIIVVALICATRLYPIWIRNDYKRTRKALELVRKVRDENDRLRKELDRANDSWFEDFDERQKSQDRAWDSIVELAEKLKIKLD